MDKRLISIGLGTFLLLGSSANSIFADGYGVAGCGLGSVIFSKNTTVLQVLAATTNGTSANQTFGISTGSLNCTTDGIVKNEKAQEIFIAQNFESLEREMSSGSGEKLNTLSHLLGCSPESANQLGLLAKTNYAKLFVKETTPSTLLSAVKDGIREDETLSRSCKI
ncbi:PF11220 family protein [Leptospira inadai serovar Lyme str. 10]|uniref:PF11220 family protein n=3 Tax=Bacteria TaxID=2 RepID=V6HC46_9LEPT|nr:DUF3015 domain-containing protein [Leptospira inadai]EQA37356.1 PF11220 family protein [Leptospira inadai serovar Lyme str. 10]PNV71905.1 DUF3015 domain-containing protein [Leptospira inadai serovar Lyme]